MFEIFFNAQKHIETWATSLKNTFQYYLFGGAAIFLFVRLAPTLLKGINENRVVKQKRLEWEEHQKLSKLDTYSQAVVAKLAEPFKPPISVPEEKLFKDEKLYDELLKLVSSDTGMYKLYYGASQLGKSTTLLQAFKGRTGVAYVSFRGKNSPADIIKVFATAIGYFGEKQGTVTDKIDVTTALRNAATYRTEKQPRILLILDDIPIKPPAEAQSLFADLLNLYTMKLISVLYIASDYQGVHAIRQGSGQSRLICELFTGFDKKAIVAQLQTVCLSTGEESKWLSAWKFFVDYISTPDRKELLDKSVAEYLVATFGNHLGHISSCVTGLASIVSSEQLSLPLSMTNEQHKEIIQHVVSNQLQPLLDHLHQFIKTSADKTQILMILEELVKKYNGLTPTDPEPELEWARFTEDKMNDPYRIMHYLVTDDVLSYKTGLTVCFSSHAVYTTYQKLKIQQLIRPE